MFRVCSFQRDRRVDDRDVRRRGKVGHNHPLVYARISRLFEAERPSEGRVV